jgi:hypothetical protein
MNCRKLSQFFTLPALVGRQVATVDALLRPSGPLCFVFFDEWVSVQRDFIGPILMTA